MHIGMIGIGLMGHGIAANILKNDSYRLTFLTHAGNQPTKQLEAAGAMAAGSIKEVVEEADIILICVTGATQVEEILFSPDGVGTYAGKGQIIIDCSTSMPEKTRLFAARLAEAGIPFVDAAMTRTPKEAAEGRLNLIVGAEKEIFDQLHPLLSQFAENIVHAGAVGSGQALKLIHNYVSLGYAAVMAEAAAQAQKQGIEPQRFLDVLHVGGGNSVVLERFRPFLTDKDISGLQFSLSNAAKDIGYYIQAYEDTPISSAVMDLFCRGVAEVGPSESVLHLTDLLAKKAKS
jgi:3-hydroxyisobutyrate dehydrogenase-like beta-hydroxyacid dehydrogenase